MTTQQEQKNKRAYNNTLRQKRARQTREAILEALTEQFVDESITELSIPRLARRAGVSEPTVYRYFPNRDELFRAWDEWWAENTEQFTMPDQPEEMSACIKELFTYYDDHEQLLRASRTRAAQLGHSLSDRHRRDQTIQDAFRARARHLRPETAGARAAVFRYLVSSLAWHTLTGDHGIESRAAAEAVQWATGLMLRDLEAGAAEE